MLSWRKTAEIQHWVITAYYHLEAKHQNALTNLGCHLLKAVLNCTLSVLPSARLGQDGGGVIWHLLSSNRDVIGIGPP